MTVKPSARQPVRLVGSGVECQVYRVLGQGTQGTVYAVGDGHGHQFALKWYDSQFADERQWQSLRNLIRIGPPDDRFLWPIELAVLPEALREARQGVAPNDFGYVMPIRDERFKEMTEHLMRHVNPGFRELAIAGFQLADSFLRLHTKGLCYQDISRGNVFFDPDSGDALICDNDNVGVDGKEGAIRGTPSFMAPEIVRDEALPSTKTDRYSLAVLLFMMFMIHHPLIGKKELSIPAWDPDLNRRLMGFEPVFIFDPDDTSNRPVPGEHDNALIFWSVYPAFLRALFVKAFTDGLGDPVHGRVTEAEWRGALARMRDLIMTCAPCRQQNFFDSSLPAGAAACYACGTRLPAPLRLVVAHHEVVLDERAKLYPHHLVPRLRYDYSAVLAEVASHADYDVTGLRNWSAETWKYATPDEPGGEVPPGKVIRLGPGTKIDFGAVTGEVLL